MPNTNTTQNDASPSIGFLFEWNAEVTRFYLSRFQKCAALPWRLTACKSPEETQEVQASFMSDLAEDYRHEANQLTNIVGGVGEDVYTARLLKAQEDAAAIIAQAKVQADEIINSAKKRAGVEAKADKETPIAAVKKSA